MISPFARYTLHHVGVVIPSLEEVEDFMRLMGLEEDYRSFVAHWSCWCVFTRSRAGATIELVVPEGGPLARFNGGFGGVHHFAFQVADITEVEAWCREQDMEMLEPAPIKGAGNFLCNFLDLASTRGVQIEFVQPLS